MTQDHQAKRATWLKVAAVAATFAIAVAACGNAASSTAPSAAASASAEATAAASASASAASGDAPLFVAINKAADQQYFIDLQTAFIAKIEELGGTAEKYDAKDQAELGVNLVNDAISKGAKGISITVPDQAIGPAVAKAAADAGIPLIATDDPIEDTAGNADPVRRLRRDGHGQEGRRGSRSAAHRSPAG